MSKESKEMIEWFKIRTNKHIELVQKYCNLIVKYFPEFSDLREKCKAHDASKFENPEYIPYIFTTWKYKCQEDKKPFKCSKKMQKEMNEVSPVYICDSFGKK